MSSITIIIGSGPHQRTFQFEEGTPIYRPLTLVIEQLNPFLPPRLAAEGYDIRVLSTETLNGEIVGGIRISKLLDEGQVDIKLLDQQGQQLGVDRELLDRVILVPFGDEPLERSIVYSAKDALPETVQGTPMERDRNDAVQGKTDGNMMEPIPGHWRASGIKIKVWEEALKKAREHAQAHPHREVGGVCIGKWAWGKKSKRWIVEITDTLIAEHTVNRGASITFTPDTWSVANRIIDRDYAGSEECMVGWYHTHPGYGIFLSSHDLFVHEHFFTQPWHIALVIDPLRNQEGFFVWGGNPKVVKRYPDDQLENLPGSYQRPAAIREKPSPKKTEEQPVKAAQVQESKATLPQGSMDEEANEVDRSMEQAF